jgi:hypothetical protein
MTLLRLKGPLLAEELGISHRTVESLRRRPENKARSEQLRRELLTRMDRAFYNARIGPMLHPEASPDELRLIALPTIKAPFGDTLL